MSSYERNSESRAAKSPHKIAAERYSVKIIVLTSLFLFAATANAQSRRNPTKVASPNPPCTLSKDKIPPIRGFHLGQKLTEISLPGIAEAYEESASKRDKPYESVLVSLYDLFPKEERDRPEFSDANFMLHFFDTRISAIFISYQEYEAENVKEFIGSAAAKLGLPTAGWKYRGIFSASLKCSDFTASLWTGRYESRPIYQAEPMVSFSDDMAEKKQERQRKDYMNTLAEAKRKRQAEDAQRVREEKAKRKIFKP